MGDIYRATIAVEVNQVATANVMYWDEVTTGSSPDKEKNLNELLTDKTIVGSFADEWAAAFCVEATISCVKIQKVAPAPVGTLKIFFDQLVGEVTGDAVPSNMAAVIRTYTEVATKRGRGRHFFAGMAESGVIDGGMSVVQFDSLQALADVMRDGITDAVRGNWELSHFSKMDDVYRPVVQTLPDSIPRMQRDRTTNLCSA